MTEAERQLVEDRAVRDGAREVLEARLARVRGALAEKPVGQRISDEALGRARIAGSKALEIARDSRWIAAGTGLAVAAWMLRGPLTKGAMRAADRFGKGEPSALWQRLREWMPGKVKP